MSDDLDRTYAEWATEAQTVVRTLREASERQVILGVELRERWDDWKGVAGYRSKDTCLRAELGISAQQLRQRLSYRRQLERQDSDADIESVESEAEQDQQPSEPEVEPPRPDFPAPRRLTPEEVEEYGDQPPTRRPSTRELAQARLERDASNAIKEGATAGEAALSALRAMTVEQLADRYADLVATQYWWQATDLCERARDSLRERVGS